MSAPPPPPPHGEVPKSSGLPPGKYDIFVIPEHSAGAGFLYLPSLKPNVNSFAAGFASALILVALFQSMAPAFRAWWETFQGLGNMGITLLILGVGFGAWALGRTQNDAPPSGYHHQSSYSSGGGGTGSGTAPGGFGSSTPGASPNGGAHPRGHGGGHGGTGPPPPPHSSPPPRPAGSGAPPPQSRAQSPPPPPQPEKPKTSWQRPSPQPSSPKPQTPKGTWEKAREETRKKEEERKAKEAEQKRREEAAKRLAELRAKEAKERQAREKEREQKDKDTKDKKLKEEAEQRRKELAERLRREKEEKEAQKKKEAASTDGATRVGSSYAFSGVGERTSMWPGGRPPASPQNASAGSSPTKNPPSPGKQPPPPTARTYVSTAEEDAFSFRPYDQPKKKPRRPSVSSFNGSEASWAQSHTTARTSPPPSVRGPYTTKDPDKIVIQAVYLFMNQYSKTPASQLVSGVGSVTDGLILRITTEGLFIDDDVRGVPQREWDVKAWTLKLVEVWCPPHCLNSSASASAASNPSGPKSAPHLLYKMATARRNADRDSQKVLNGDEADAYLIEMLRACKDCCRLGLCERTFKNTNIPTPTGQTGAWKVKGLHVLRATVRDQEGKRYMFVMNETESWKLAFGLQRLRGGTQVRQLGVAGMTPSEARGTLEMLGWS